LEIFAFDIAQSSQLREERKVRGAGLVTHHFSNGKRWVDDRDTVGRRKLLPARRERPRDRAADKRNELP
jgi:hypothetical protein